MMIANATGCSSIWAASTPASAYTINENGHGPAWANSLFEDNAEFGYGMYLGVKAIRERLANNVKMALDNDIDDEVKEVLREWLDNKDVGDSSRERAQKVINILENYDNEFSKIILQDKEFLVKRSQWIFGGDGWAYDIGYGGDVYKRQTKDLLLNVLKYKPFLIKPNHHELAELFNVTLNDDHDIIKYGKKLQEMGAKNVLISMAGDGAILIPENKEPIKREVPKGVLKNSVGAGDSMVAGFISGSVSYTHL